VWLDDVGKGSDRSTNRTTFRGWLPTYFRYGRASTAWPIESAGGCRRRERRPPPFRWGGRLLPQHPRVVRIRRGRSL